MALWVGIDFETSGLSPKEDRITEVAAVLWDTEKKSPLLVFNKFVDCGVEISEKITQLTGITQQMINDYGEDPERVMKLLNNFCGMADYFVAHNAPFDRGFYTEECLRHKFVIPSIPWIDTCTDLPVPPEKKARKLLHMAAEHGILNPFSHRAVTDVLTMLMIASKYDPRVVEECSRVENITVRAMVQFETKDKASSQGYRWDKSQGVKGVWLKNIKANMLEEERKQCDFPVEVWT